MSPNSYWDGNITALESAYPGLAGELAKNKSGQSNQNQSAQYELNSQIETAVSGEPTLTINGVLIHSRHDPRREAARQAEALFQTQDVDKTAPGGGLGPLLVLGFGLGYGVEALSALRKKAPGPTEGNPGPPGPIIVVEKNPLLFTLALETRDLRELFAPGDLILVIGGGSGGVTGALALLEKSGTAQGKPLIVKNRALTSLTTEDEEWYAEAERRIITWASKDDINAATLTRFGKRWTGNLAANLSVIRDLPGVSRLGGILSNPARQGQDRLDRGFPVFLAAAGPSLDALEDHLGAIRDRCAVIAVDTSLRFLTERGIFPDFVVSVDPQYWNARHLHRVHSPGSCLIAESAVYPPVLRESVRTGADGRSSFSRAFLCQSLFPLGRYIEDRTDPKGILGAGGSVATTAWDFARLLGPDEIWIAGLDLSFPGLKTHFKGALFEENVHAQSGRFLPAETSSLLALRSGFPFPAPAMDGGRVLTDRRLSLYAAWFENRFSQERALQSKSLSSRGLAIPRLIPGDIGELLALPPRREELDRLLGETFARIEGDFNSAPEKTRREESYAEALQSLIGGLEEIRESSEQAGNFAKNALQKHNKIENGAGNEARNEAEQEKILAKLERTNKLIRESPVKDPAGFLFPPSSELERELRVPTSQPFRRHLEFSALLYQRLAESAGYTLERLKASR
jgi:hypothetical protein